MRILLDLGFAFQGRAKHLNYFDLPLIEGHAHGRCGVISGANQLQHPYGGNQAQDSQFAETFEGMLQGILQLKSLGFEDTKDLLDGPALGVVEDNLTSHFKSVHPVRGQ